MKAYHFNDGKTLRDGRPLPPIGQWLEQKGKLQMCENGLHASIHPMDALGYAEHSHLDLVELGGEILRETDKCCASRRKRLATINTEPILWSFARRCALDVIDKWDAPQVVIDYLKTGNEELRDSARDAAWDSARDAARSAARDAARDVAWAAARAAARDVARVAARDAARDVAWVAARAAARAAAWDAARDAAWDAARDAARDAAWVAARAAARDVAWDAARAAARAAAWDAARDAAWDAARAKYRRWFKQMVDRELKAQLKK